MNKPSDFTQENLDPYLGKNVVVTHKNKDSDPQIVRGKLLGTEMGRHKLPLCLIIQNESGDRVKISIYDVEDLREGE